MPGVATLGAASRLIYLGLDYTAVRAGLKLAGIALTAEQWRGLQTVEAAARDALNEADA